MGSVGARAFLPTTGRFRAALGVGAGLGCGGVSKGVGGCKQEVGGIAGGGYGAVDLGVRLFPWLGLYLDTRLQIAKADYVPLTGWATSALGVQLDPEALGGLFMTLEGAVAYFANNVNSGLSLGGSAGLGARFGSL